MLIFDSGAFPEHDRAEALSAALSEIETPQTVTFSAGGPVRHRMEAFELGPGVHLLRNSGTPLQVRRSARHVRQGTREEVVFHVQSRGGALITADGGVCALRPGQLGAVDVTRPYAVRQLGESENSALVVEFGRLDLPVDQIRAAIPALGRSPLYELFREHVLRLNLELPADAAAMTGQATVDLIAALVGSVRDHPRASPQEFRSAAVSAAGSRPR